jgi:hypothetical protein
MISKPFLQRMAILVFKKMRSYASDGREKSCQIALIILLSSGRGHKYPVDTEPLRAGLPQTKSRTGKNWSLSVLIYLANNGFKYAEDAVQLVHPVRSA